MRNLKMELTGDRNQCPTCGEYFSTTKAFERHRVGNFDKKTRRCLSVSEIRAYPMRKDSKGFWKLPQYD